MAMIEDWLGAEGPERKRRLGIGLAGILVLLLVGVGSVYLPTQPSSGGSGAEEARTSNAVTHVNGFRSATFGMSEGAVRAAIASDFKIKPAAVASSVKVVENKIERTRILVVRVPDLFNGGGLTEIGYVFGYQSKALIQVNLLWGTPLSPEATVDDISIVTANLMRYFAAEGFARDHVRHNVRIGKGAMLVFQGSDAKGRMVQLVRRGELIPAAKNAAGEKTAEPTKRLTLRLAYIANPKAPDTFKIAKGAF